MTFVPFHVPTPKVVRSMICQVCSKKLTKKSFISACSICSMKFHKKYMSGEICTKCNSPDKTSFSSTPVSSTSPNPLLPSEYVDITPPPLTTPHLTRSPLSSLKLGDKIP